MRTMTEVAARGFRRMCPDGVGSAKPDRPDRPERGDDGREAQILIDDDPAGDLRLEGLVLTADDKPVAGATVVVSTNPSRHVTTDTDGSFAFDKLVGRPYTLVARAPTGVGGPVTAKLTATSDPVVLKLHPAGSVKVTTVDKAGKHPGEKGFDPKKVVRFGVPQGDHVEVPGVGEEERRSRSEVEREDDERRRRRYVEEPHEPEEQLLRLRRAHEGLEERDGR